MKKLILFLFIGTSHVLAFGTKPKQGGSEDLKIQTLPSSPVRTQTQSEKLQVRWLWVSVPSSKLQCDPKLGQHEKTSLELNRLKLEKAKVKVIRAEAKSDGMMKASMCGMSSGEIDTFQIEAQDLEKALALGFTQL